MADRDLDRDTLITRGLFLAAGAFCCEAAAEAVAAAVAAALAAETVTAAVNLGVCIVERFTDKPFFSRFVRVNDEFCLADKTFVVVRRNDDVD